MERVREQGLEIQEIPSSLGVFSWISEVWFMKHIWKIVSVNADSIDCVIQRKVMLCSKSGRCSRNAELSAWSKTAYAIGVL